MQLGVGGIFSIMMVREVLSFLAKRRNGKFPQSYLSEKERAMLRDIHLWLSKEDNEGYKLVYTRKDHTLEMTIGRLADAIEKLTEIQGTEFDILKEMARDMRDIRDRAP